MGLADLEKFNMFIWVQRLIVLPDFLSFFTLEALAVIEYLVAHGSERAVDEIIEHTFQISVRMIFSTFPLDFIYLSSFY